SLVQAVAAAAGTFCPQKGTGPARASRASSSAFGCNCKGWFYLALVNFPGSVVAVLLGPEHAPACMEWGWNLGSKQAADTRIAVGLVPAGDFVVAVVLKGGNPAELRIESCGSVPSFGKDADRLVGRVAVVGVQVEQVRGIERVALRVQRVASVFHKDHAVLVPERAVIQSGMRDVAAVDD